jgi:hypothetical protein
MCAEEALNLRGGQIDQDPRVLAQGGAQGTLKPGPLAGVPTALACDRTSRASVCARKSRSAREERSPACRLRKQGRYRLLRQYQFLHLFLHSGLLPRGLYCTPRGSLVVEGEAGSPPPEANRILDLTDRSGRVSPAGGERCSPLPQAAHSR